MKNKNLFIILTIYIVSRIYLIIYNSSTFTNIINPIFWTFMLIYLLYDIKKNYIRLNHNKNNVNYMIIISCIQVIFYFYLGFIFGFSKSPYNHKILYILKNITIQILPIIVIELTRSVITTRNKNNKIAITFATILLMLAEINYNALTNLYPDKQELFKYLCENIFPLISCSILYTYLSLIGSYSLSLACRVFKELAQLLLPIWPNINWFIKGSTSIISVVIVYVLYKYVFNKKDIPKKRETFFSKFSYSITLIFAIALICFMVGIFKYESIVILSNSMVPTFSHTDIVIYKKLDEEQLQKIPIGSIIVYSIDDQNIAHRIVNIVKDENIMYQTKGDSNNAPDINLVKINQIKGVYVFHIKYLGFPSVWLHEYLNSDSAKVEIK